jgi:triphosphoribosyl-dephospho-CoA synthetase
MSATLDDLLVELQKISRDIKVIRDTAIKVCNDLLEGHSEVPEKIRRFMMYMHDVHDTRNMYTEHGLPVPPYIDREAERCADRYRQLLEELHTDGGRFEKIRREMASDPNNRYDHKRLLSSPTEGG